MTASAPVLERRLGPFDAAAIVVSNVIGGGILFSPPQIAASVPSALLFLSTWVVGGLLAFAGAMAYDLGAAFAAKRTYNAARADHKAPARAAHNGKKY